MSKHSDLAALAAAAIASGRPVTRLPAGYASAPLVQVSGRSVVHEIVRNMTTTVIDHNGVEHVKNAEGEWLY